MDPTLRKSCCVTITSLLWAAKEGCRDIFTVNCECTHTSTQCTVRTVVVSDLSLGSSDLSVYLICVCHKISYSCVMVAEQAAW